MTRNQKIALFGAIAGSTIAFLIYNRAQKKLLFSTVLERIGKRSQVFSDYKEYFLPTRLPIIRNSVPNLVVMNDVLVKEKSDALTKALIGWTEDESAVYNVFNDVPDLTAVTQISSYYSAANPTTLFDDLSSYLSDSELAKIAESLSQKPLQTVVK